MRRLGARRHRRRHRPGAGTRRSRPWRRCRHRASSAASASPSSWLSAVDLEPVELAQHLRPLDAGAPHHQLRGRRTRRRSARTPSARTSLTRAPVRTSTPSFFSSASVASDTRAGSAGRMRSAASMRMMRMSLLGIDAVEAEGDDLARGAVQLGGELGPGGAGADDRDMKLAGPHRLCLGIGADAGIDQAAVEAHRLLRRVERHGIAGGAGRAEIVGDAADGDHQRVVADGARRRDLRGPPRRRWRRAAPRSWRGRGRSSRRSGTGNDANGPARGS